MTVWKLSLKTCWLLILFPFFFSYLITPIYLSCMLHYAHKGIHVYPTSTILDRSYKAYLIPFYANTIEDRHNSQQTISSFFLSPPFVSSTKKKKLLLNQISPNPSETKMYWCLSQILAYLLENISPIKISI